MKTGRGWWALAGMLGVPVLLFAGYVGAYYSLVRPVRWRWGAIAVYRVSEKWDRPAQMLFDPINRIDRKLRPQEWAPQWP